MDKVRSALVCGALAAGMLVVVAPDEGVAAGGGGRSVSIEHRQFVPRELTVSVGDEVTWTHRDGEQVHSVTADDGSFDSNPLCSTANPKECMSDHDTFKQTFGTEGRFPYFSKTFGGPGGQGTSGVIVVVTAAPPTPKAPPKKGTPPKPPKA
jgi:plastocyanin